MERGNPGACALIPCDAADAEGVVTLAQAMEAREVRLRTKRRRGLGRAGRDHPIEQVDRVLKVNVWAVLHGNTRCRPLAFSACCGPQGTMLTQTGHGR